MIAYASRTGTRRNLAAMRAAGWRLIVSATGVLRHEGFRYALDNGAWTAHQNGTPFDERAFSAALARLGADADWTVLPDIVGGGLRSLDMSVRWMARVLNETPRVLIAVQDGMSLADVEPLVGGAVGVFVGGSTGWKLRTMREWCALARNRDVVGHVGRVNTRRRVLLCAQAGATSFDGTSATRFASTLRPLDAARRQLALGGIK